MTEGGWIVLMWAVIIASLWRNNGFWNSGAIFLALAMALFLPVYVCLAFSVVVVVYRIYYKVWE